MDLGLRYALTIDEINYSDSFNDNWDLFNKGVKILSDRLKNDDFSEFSISERDILEQIFSIINNENEN